MVFSQIREWEGELSASNFLHSGATSSGIPELADIISAKRSHSLNDDFSFFWLSSSPDRTSEVWVERTYEISDTNNGNATVVGTVEVDDFLQNVNSFSFSAPSEYWHVVDIETNFSFFPEGRFNYHRINLNRTSQYLQRNVYKSPDLIYNFKDLYNVSIKDLYSPEFDAQSIQLKDAYITHQSLLTSKTSIIDRNFDSKFDLEKSWSLSFFAHAVDWNSITGHLIVGNYFGEGIGIFNNNETLTPHISFQDIETENFYVFNNEGVWVDRYSIDSVNKIHKIKKIFYDESSIALIENSEGIRGFALIGANNTVKATTTLSAGDIVVDFHVDENRQIHYVSEDLNGDFFYRVFAFDSSLNPQEISSEALDPNNFGLSAIQCFNITVNNTPIYPARNDIFQIDSDAIGNIYEMSDYVIYKNRLPYLFTQDTQLVLGNVQGGYIGANTSTGNLIAMANPFPEENNPHPPESLVYKFSKFIIDRKDRLWIKTKESLACCDQNGILKLKISPFDSDDFDFDFISWIGSGKRFEEVICYSNEKQKIITIPNTDDFINSAKRSAISIRQISESSEWDSKMAFRLNYPFISNLSATEFLAENSEFSGDWSTYKFSLTDTGYDYQRKYGSKIYPEDSISFRITTQNTKSPFEVQREIVNISKAILEPGWHQLSVVGDIESGKISFYVDGKLNSEVSRNKNLFGIKMNEPPSHFSVGTNMAATEPLNQYLKKKSNYNFSGKLSSILFIQRPLKWYEIDGLYKEIIKGSFTDLIWDIPYVPRAYVEKISLAYQLKVPALKSNFVNVRLKNNSLTLTNKNINKLTETISQNIIKAYLPVNSKIFTFLGI